MVYQRIAAFVPKGFADNIRGSLSYLNINIDERKFLGFLVAYGFAMGIAVALLLMVFLELPFLIGFFGAFIVFVGGVYVYLGMAAESKGRIVEKVLPDALQLIASNIKSGLTTERALFTSARPEFGPLEFELKRASKEIVAGSSVDKALLAMGGRIKSTTFERTVWLIAKGIRSGGQISDLLIQLSDDLREQQAVQGENQAETSMYIMLIFIAAAFGAPILFGVSSFIVSILTKQLANLPTIEVPSGAALPSQLNPLMQMAQKREIVITPEFVLVFSIAAMFVTAFFAAMTIGVINTGKAKQGWKFMPLIFIIGLFLFYAIRFGLQSVFGGLLGT
ncbi:MAG: type II secretion system F family protein [Candidatus Micrarchaeota archaeon]